MRSYLRHKPPPPTSQQKNKKNKDTGHFGEMTSWQMRGVGRPFAEAPEVL
jgi:hypothetical protein